MSTISTENDTLFDKNSKKGHKKKTRSLMAMELSDTLFVKNQNVFKVFKLM